MIGVFLGVYELLLAAGFFDTISGMAGKAHAGVARVREKVKETSDFFREWSETMGWWQDLMAEAGVEPKRVCIYFLIAIMSIWARRTITREEEENMVSPA